ncbi:MAG: hypothetical protein J6O39_02315 [Treponema sp.]|uniref:Tocopherol cyclase n=1 Tax=Treponema rectale TaxID=744512 RepID=A0A840S8H8_9SPIR|nr:hypothetical protein [Treponema rectale]MBB5217967.1 hypothetical protein [Treponema rectale]MBO6176363.1 hypothetical protein [Treponema sp.]QOS40316.1 hypothetical protein DYE49_07540 [Treponema rectale]
MDTKRIRRNSRYMLKGALRKSGFDCWRLVTCGISRKTGEEKTFFIEYYVVNPALSPDDVVLGFKSRFAGNEADLQYALAGTESAKTFTTESLVQPSFVMVKAGVLSKGGSQLNAYYPSSQLKINDSNFILSVGPGERPDCVLSDDYSVGRVAVTREQLLHSPEILGNPGWMEWNLRFEQRIEFQKNYSSKDVNWAAFGAKTDFNGEIIYNGEEYIVTAKKSFGYFDKTWGREFVNPVFHLNASNCLSVISGKNLFNSCFAVQGEFSKKLSVLVDVEGLRCEFSADKSKKFSLSYDFTQMPVDEEGEKLHWTVSVHNKKYIIDIDIYCLQEDMSLREYECPEGGRKLMKVLSGASGYGELKIFKSKKKNIELIEQVKVSNCVCEYGNVELPEL